MILLFLVGTNNVHAKGNYQSLNLNLENSSLIEFFNVIKAQSDYTFLYNVDDVKNVKAISITTNEAKLQEVLNLGLSHTGLTYELRDNVVVIKPEAKQAKVEVNTSAQQSKRTITGFVKDDTGFGLPGVSVVVKGTSIGASTGMDGDYAIKIPGSGNVVLIYSFIGMDSQEVVITDQKVVNIVLGNSSEQIGEIVVTGYQKIDRKLFTGAATRVKMADIKLASESDISKSLEGQVAGVSVQNVSSTFGTAPKIRIRGSSSIYGNQNPLWVIDGVVLEDAVEISSDALNSGDLSTLVSSGVAGLNMDDIETFQILKDASATALYGARAMNGVIVITTKKGKSGKINVNYSMGLTVKPIPSYDDYNIMNSKDQMSVNRELYEKGWINIAKTQFSKSQGPYGKMFGHIAKNEMQWGQNNNEINSFLRKYETANTDWFDEVFQTGIQTNHTLSVSGGSDKSTFYTSLGYFNDGGWTIADNVSRYTALLKGTFNLSDKFTITAQSNMSYRDQTVSGASASDTNKDNVGGVDRYTGRVNRDFDTNPFLYALTTSRNLRAYDDSGDLEYFRRNYNDFNILQELKNNTTAVTVKDMSFTANLNYELKKNLTFGARLSARFYDAKIKRLVNENSNEANAYRAGMNPGDSEILRDANTFLFELPGTNTGIKYSILPEGGIYSTTNNTMENYYFNGNVNWNPKLGEDNLFTFFLGSEMRYIDRSKDWNKGYGHFYNLGNASKPSENYLVKLGMDAKSYFGRSNSYDRFTAFFFNYGYSYQGKYTVNGTVRHEGSNRLGQSTTARWFTTWNLSGKWAAKEEAFLQDVDFLNLLNVRVGYGLNGSLGSATNASLVAYSKPNIRPLHPGASQLQIEIDQLENSNLSWEKQYEFNTGIDFAVLNHRISGEFNFYKKNGFDLIGKYMSNGVGGKRTKWGNVADVNSHGFELNINFIPVQLDDFKWNLGFNYSYHKSKISKLISTDWVGRASSIYGVPVLDGPVKGVYSSRFAGLDTNGVPTFYNRDDEKVHYLNVQTDDYSDFTYSGNLEPTTNLGISNTFKYKNIALSVLITGQFGHKKRVMQDFSYSYDDFSSLSSHLKNRWRVKGDETKTNIPAILDRDAMNKEGFNKIATAYKLYGMSDLWIADASFVRLKNISLSYSLPKNILTKISLQKVNFSLQASNVGLLWLADKDKLNGEDPEFVWSGGTTMPITKQYTFTLSVGF